MHAMFVKYSTNSLLIKSNGFNVQQQKREKQQQHKKKVNPQQQNDGKKTGERQCGKWNCSQCTRKHEMKW